MKKHTGDLLWAAAYLALFAFAIYFLFNFKLSQVSGHSMEPTLHDLDVLITRDIDGPEDITAGDLLIFQKEEEFGDDYLVKRVYGVPGDAIQFPSYETHINGTKIEHAYLQTNIAMNLLMDDETIPPNCYFVLGDNRDHSTDSRFFGYARYEDCHQIVVRVFSPPKPVKQAFVQLSETKRMVIEKLSPFIDGKEGSHEQSE